MEARPLATAEATGVLVTGPSSSTSVGGGEGVAAEYQYLKEKFPGGQRGSQALAVGQDGRRYDVIEWIEADGTAVRVCFDINQFFGNDESLQ